MNNLKVYVTGIGAVTSLGNSAGEMWNNIRAGRVGIGKLTKFESHDFPTKVASEVHDLKPQDYLDRKEIQRNTLDRWKEYLLRLIPALTDEFPGCILTYLVIIKFKN